MDEVFRDHIEHIEIRFACNKSNVEILRKNKNWFISFDSILNAFDLFRSLLKVYIWVKLITTVFSIIINQ